MKSAAIALCFAALASCSTLPRVTIQTELGDIEAIVDTRRAPLTATNFLAHVDRGSFRDASFYRVVRMDNQPKNDVKIEVIQGGAGGDGVGKMIRHETTDETGILHRNGTVSMARMDPGTANTEFFICVDPQPELDFGGRRNPDGQGFAAFGRVTKGMDVVRKIQKLRDKGQYLVTPLKIQNVVRLPTRSPESGTGR